MYLTLNFLKSLIETIPLKTHNWLSRYCLQDSKNKDTKMYIVSHLYFYYFHFSWNFSSCDLMVNNLLHLVSKKRGSPNKPTPTSLILTSHVLVYYTRLHSVISVSKRRGSDSLTLRIPTSLIFHTHMVHVLHYSV